MKIVINETNLKSETEIIINCHSTDENILKIIATLKAFDNKLTGIKDGKTFVLNLTDVLYIDTADKHTFIYTSDNVFDTPLKLYELEERLAGDDFVRISKQCIINFAKINNLRPDFGGKLLLTMTNGEQIFVSRQYANIIKTKLGL